MIVFHGTKEQCAKLVIAIHRRGGFDAILGTSRTTVTIYRRNTKWYGCAE
jgi:hypothetical protein